MTNTPVSSIDLRRYAGTWYSIASIPTLLDRHWRETVEHYTLNAEGYYDVVTTYKKGESEKLRRIASKLFPGKVDAGGDMKAQFLWPFKIAYRIILLDRDYSWVVVGHPDKKYLFMMSRKPEMGRGLFEALRGTCRDMGYDTARLTMQGHDPGVS